MTFTSYLEYEKYLELGGTVSRDAFPILERKAQRLLDYITFNRIPKLKEIPEEVYEVLTEFIDNYHDFDKQKVDGEVIEKYSNGVETIAYRRTSSNQFKKELTNMAYTILPDYLVNRSLNFDVEDYLQSTNNNT